jgi:hypothetical protein
MDKLRLFLILHLIKTPEDNYELDHGVTSSYCRDIYGVQAGINGGLGKKIGVIEGSFVHLQLGL